MENEIALHLGCLYGSVDAVRLLLEANADKDRVAGRSGATPICLALQMGHLESGSRSHIVKASADKDKDANDGTTLLCFA